jgi:hypothetical protein
MVSEKTNLGRSEMGTDSIYDSPQPELPSLLLEPAAETPITPASHESPPSSDRAPPFDQLEPISQEVFVDAIMDAAASIESSLDELPEPLGDELAAWIDLHGFDADRDPVQQIVARQAIFHLSLKATLCEAKFRHHDADLPALTAEPRQALQTASAELETPAVDEYILDDVAWLADDDDELAAVLSLRTQLLTSSQPAADIGRLYAALTPQESRRSLGQYRTPPEFGDLMQQWSASSDTCVLDPGMGAAVLSTPGLPRWITNSEHDYVVGIDRSPLAALMGATALTLYGKPHEIHVDDFMEIQPKDLSKSSDAVKINPPYVRYDRLPADYREELKTQVAQEADIEISGTPPLHVFFVLHARQFLAAGDTAAFLTPQAVLATDYGEPLRKHLLSEYDIAALILFNPAERSVFDDANTTGLISLVEATDDVEGPGPIQCIRVDGDPDTGRLLEAVRHGEQGKTDWGFINKVSQAELTPQQHWQALFDPPEVDVSALTPLSDFADVQRGPTTGKNEFFCLTQNDVDEIGIDESYLSPMVPSSQHVHGYDFREADWERARAEGKPVWMLYHLDDGIEVPDSGSAPTIDCSAIQQYLHTGEEEYGLHESPTAGSRSPWYRIRRREPTSVLVSYWSREDIRFVLNETDVRHINNFYGFSNVRLTRSELKALLAFLNSGVVDEVLRWHQRSYGEGLVKVEPNDLEDVPVLDPRTVDDDRVAVLANAFDDLREASRTDGRQDAMRTRINQLILREI